MNGGNVIKANVSWFQMYVKYAILQNYFHFSEIFWTNTYNFRKNRQIKQMPKIF